MRNPLLALLGLLLCGSLAVAGPALPSYQGKVTARLEPEPFQGCSLACAMDWMLRSSSHLKAQGSHTYAAPNINDSKAVTAWVEGAKGDGVGEWVEFDMRADGAASAPFRGIRVANGYSRTAQTWRDNGRVRRLRMDINGRPVCHIDLADSPDEQAVNIPEREVRRRDKIRFTIVSVYPGARFQDTCINEMVLDGAH